jgi:muconolactone D-isomerase
MQFLVKIRLHLPADMDPEMRAQLREEERARNAELEASGTIVRSWRIPGQPVSVAIWDASSTTALLDLIRSLPTFPWTATEATPLVAKTSAKAA